MKRRFDQVKVLVSYEIAKFIMKKHENPIKRQLASLLAKINVARFGRDPLGFMEESDSKDEQF